MKDLNQNRKAIIQIFFVIGAFVLLARTAQLQLFDSSYKRHETVTGVQEITLYPARGLIYDRNGKLIVYNDALYDIKVTYNQVKDIDTTMLCELLNIDLNTFKKNLHKDFKKDPRFSEWIPYVFLKKLSAESYARFQEHLYKFPGFFAELRIVRGYSEKVGAHILGYVSEVSGKEIEASDGYYSEGDYAGKTGLERKYESSLRGEKGKRYVMKDNMGRIEGSYKNGSKDIAPISGKNLYTTLDIDLQAYAEKLLQNKIGAVVALDPSTGGVLAMASSPTYAPDLLAINRNRSEAFTKLASDSLKPLLNRALNAQYPPGSIFKTVMSLVGLQEGVFAAHRGISCRGAYFYNGRRFGCRNHPEGIHNLAKALQYSCNTFYFQGFRDILEKSGYENADKGLDTLVAHLYRFGLGKPMGIDLAGEESGNVPTSAYYDKVYGKGVWRSPFIISLGIGQGEYLITPVQMANMAAIIANRGHYYIPHIAQHFEGNEDAGLSKYQVRKETNIDPAHFEAVMDGMELAALGGRIEGHVFCGKTGTVQNPFGEDHSAFIAFAPRENPKIAIAVYIENSGYGSRFARPIASLLTEKYLKGDIDRENPQRVWMEKTMLEADLIPK